ncbi:MAG: NAD(+) synthase [Candidatus Melainabacteria bacterium]|nr:NAD(+) synthase [Candidatus Melainabacteria bacterium]
MKRTKRAKFGLIRIALGSHRVEIANCEYNGDRIINMMQRAAKVDANFLVLNELGTTAYTCGNHFRSEVVREASDKAIDKVRLASKTVFKGVTVIGAPIVVDGELYNCAVVIQRGRILGIVPKTYLPNTGEFHEKLWFSRGDNLRGRTVNICGLDVPIGVDLLFEADDFPGLVFGIEVCEDGWAVIPPHRLLALAGATVLINLSASNELVAKDDYRRSMIAAHSSQAQAIYAYASAGSGESSTDLVYGGHLLLGELGNIQTEAEPLADKEDEPFRYADVDVQHVTHERMRDSTFEDCRRTFASMLNFRRIKFSLNAGDLPEKLARSIDGYPFVPRDPATRNRRCRQVIKIQVRALKTRLLYLAKLRGGLEKMVAELIAAGKPLFVVGISGGVDSTECLLVALKTLDELGIPRSLLHCFTLPGFGTTSRTYGNAIKLMQLTGVTLKEVDIKARCLLAWQSEHKTPFGINLDGLTVEAFVEKLKDLPAGSADLDFENEQARQRTHILMNNGFVLGTGTLTELASGWCTYNADHMSMYSVSPGVAKTLIAFLIRWYAENEIGEGQLRDVLNDIAATAESPELLPVGRNGENAQKSNDTLGPKDLRDFFLYHWNRWGSRPSKILYLSSQAKFNQDYPVSGIVATLRQYIWRFITQRYKHSCQPDGVKLGSVSLNPRYDCHLPSDTAPDAWKAELEEYLGQKPTEINWLEPKPEEAAMKPKPKKVLKVLLRVDIKVDFMPGGSLAVKGGDEIVPAANALSRSGLYDLVVDIEDDHPAKHKSFYTMHKGKEPFSFKTLYGVKQQLWWPHCINGTPGSEFHPDLDRSMVSKTFQKGQDLRVDSYSGFYDNGRTAAARFREKYPFLGRSTGLAEYLRAEAERLGCDEIQIDVIGLALRYCVSYTAKDGRGETYKGKQFSVRVIEDAVRAIAFADGEYEQELVDLRALGIEVIHSSEVLPKLA